MKVLILAETAAHDLAQSLVADLQAPDIESAMRVLPRFPTGDGLPLLLQSVSRLAEVVLVCLSDSRESRWMAKELALRNLYPNLTTAFPSANMVGTPWSGSADMLVHGVEPALAFVRRHAGVC
jgi:hypothetical protein